MFDRVLVMRFSTDIQITNPNATLAFWKHSSKENGTYLRFDFKKYSLQYFSDAVET